jgi:hypothetical protein
VAKKVAEDGATLLAYYDAKINLQDIHAFEKSI